jgi:hypothetical protein
VKVIEYIKSLFTKPHYQFNFIDGIVMVLIVMAVVGLCLSVLYLYTHIQLKIIKRRAIKKAKEKKDGDIR